MSKVQGPRSNVWVAMILFLLIAGEAWANHTAIEGGLRSGLALGLRSEYDLNQTMSIRFGLDGSTGTDLTFSQSNPLVLSAGLDSYVTSLSGNRPLEIGAGLVVYSGDNSYIGPYLHLIVDNLNGNQDLYGEAGVDFVDGGHLQVMVGYKLWTTYSPVENPY